MRPSLYAAAIEKSISQDPSSVERVLARTRELLKARGHERLYGKVLSLLLRQLEEKAERQGATLIVAKESDASVLEASVRKKAAELGVTGALTVRTDPTLVGGYQLRAGSHFIDASYRRSLITLFEKIRGNVWTTHS